MILLGSGPTPVVMPVFPAPRTTAPPPPHYSPYSPSRFNIDKRCRHSCTWKCSAIGLILLSVALTAMLAYFVDSGVMAEIIRLKASKSCHKRQLYTLYGGPTKPTGLESGPNSGIPACMSLQAEQ
ncbi:hypothetical protein O3M35_006128 [Rhynocoris fuscipes]|uniref:Uncharacterized protein n=1 Tax=Rhynocoris fuscipes TaxID=488301 RepID=A0AAW1DD11_9HEMI